MSDGGPFEPDSDTVTGPAVAGAPPEPELAVREIQGVVLPGFATMEQHLVGLRFGDAAALRGWLREHVDAVSSLGDVNDARNERRRARRREQPRPATPLWTGITLSADALQLLGVEPSDLGDVPFAVGMSARSALLGDPGSGEEGHSSTWIVGGDATTTPHVLVILGHDNCATLDSGAAAVASGATQLLFEQRGVVLDGEREHFGFRDGVSQVGVRGRLSDGPQHFLTRRWIDPADRHAVGWARPGQPLVWPGQFVFGYQRQDRTDPVTPKPAWPTPVWTHNGSILAFRRLRQNVAAFRSFVAHESSRLVGIAGFERWTEAELAGAFVGRWPDGSALARCVTPDAAALDDQFSANHFGYATPTADIEVSSDRSAAAEPSGLAASPPTRPAVGVDADAAGLRCPQFAHVRKVNPRDLATDQGGPDATLTFQVLRRGITWGDPFDGTKPDDGDRGLLFMCWQTRTARQFELLTTRWMNQAGAPEGSAGHDMLVGQDAERSCMVRGADGTSQPIATTSQWVIPTGGGYFFAPAISTLRAWAKGGIFTS